jgi:signal peptidase II
MTTRLRLVLLSLVMLTCVGCDQAAKAMARDSLVGRTISLLGGAVRFEYAENTGAFLSLGSSLPSGMRSLLFVGGTGVIVLCLLVAMARGSQGGSPSGSLGLALLAGGAVGNLIDRLAYDGAVVDFVSVGLGGLRTGIFNLADVSITIGVILVAMQGWRTASAAEPAGTS